MVGVFYFWVFFCHLISNIKLLGIITEIEDIHNEYCNPILSFNPLRILDSFI